MELIITNSTVPRMMVIGEIDYGNVKQFRDGMDQLVQLACDAPEVDLSRVGFIDSSGISVLLQHKRTLRLENRILNLVAMSQAVYDILFKSGLVDVLGIDNDPRTGPASVSRECGCRWLVSSFDVSAGLTSPAVIRERVSRLLNDLPLSEVEIADIKLAVGEAASNAVKYGCKNGSNKIHVQCSADSSELVIEVSDYGPGFDPLSVPKPSFVDLPPGGMGIHLMRLVMDDVKFGFKDGTTVRMIKRLKPKNAA